MVNSQGSSPSASSSASLACARPPWRMHQRPILTDPPWYLALHAWCAHQQSAWQHSDSSHALHAWYMHRYSSRHRGPHPMRCTHGACISMSAWHLNPPSAMHRMHGACASTLPEVLALISCAAGCATAGALSDSCKLLTNPPAVLNLAIQYAVRQLHAIRCRIWLQHAL
jgi:hypothetical protein